MAQVVRRGLIVVLTHLVAFMAGYGVAAFLDDSYHRAHPSTHYVYASAGER